MSDSTLLQGRAELFKAFAKAQQSLKPVPKTEYNPHFKSWFAPLESIIMEVNRVFKPVGLCFTQQVVSGSDELAGVRVVTSIHHESGQSFWDAAGCYIPAVKSNPQSFGAAITYARRYGLSTLVGIATEDIDGAAAAGSKPRQASTEKTRSAPKPKTVDKLAQDRAALLQRINALNLEHRTALGKFFATKGLVWDDMTADEIRLVDLAVTERETKRA